MLLELSEHMTIQNDHCSCGCILINNRYIPRLQQLLELKSTVFVLVPRPLPQSGGASGYEASPTDETPHYQYKNMHELPENHMYVCN